MTKDASFRRSVAFLSAFVALSLGVFIYWVTLSGQTVVPKSAYRLNVTVPSAISLANHADVRQAGVKIGSVTGVKVAGDHAIVALAIDKGRAPAYRDARVLVRGKTLIGENYIDLDPGSPRAAPVPDGGTLAITQAPESTQLDQVLATLDAKRRRDVQRILDVLGGGLRGRGRDVNRFLEATAGTVDAARPVVATLAADRTQVASLVADFGDVMREVGQRGTSIRTFALRGHALAVTLAARDRALRSTLAELPSFLRHARATSGRLGDFSAASTPVMRDMRRATEQLAPAMGELRPAAEASRSAIRRLATFTRRAAPLAQRLRPFATNATAFAGPLEATLREANPLAAYLARFTPEFGSIFGGMRSATEVYDAVGHLTRVGLVITKSGPVGLVTPQQDQALHALFAAGILKDADTRGYNAYPGPGGALQPQPPSGGYQRVERDPPYGKKPY